MATVGGWCLLWEIKLSYVQLQDVQFSSDGSLTVTLNLPVSKANPAGKGADRSHKCACGMPGGRSSYPNRFSVD